MAQQSARPGPEEPDVLIVPRARVYDLVPVRELPYGPAAPSLHQRPDRWQHPTTCQSSSKYRLHLAGRPQMSTRPGFDIAQTLGPQWPRDTPTSAAAFGL
jgi:hypothetical protein